jgi:hypothetical protein
MDESNCYFVSSFGLAKSMCQYPIMYKNGAKYNFNYDNIYGETVYVRIVDVISFFDLYLEKFKEPIILVTGDMDTTVPDDILNCLQYCDNPKILLWYAQNLNITTHSKLRHLPIGLDYHTLNLCNTNVHEWGNKSTPNEQEIELLALKNSMKKIQYVINNKAVTNFHLSTYGHPLRRQQNREPVLHALKNNSSVIWLERQKRLDFWKSCDKQAFVICPFGNGLDTHRTWEVLCLGRIPIIGKSYLNKVFEDLPVVEIDDWNKLSQEWLEQKYKIIVEKWDLYNWDKLSLKYWVNKIKN